MSGFGQTGPRRKEPGYDAVMQGEGGLMSITGPSDGPAYRLGVAIADITTGMFAAIGVAMALLARHRTDRGQLVDVSMLDTVAALLTYQAGIYFATGDAPQRMGNRHPTIVPYETLEASDGELVVAVGNDTLWRSFCSLLEANELAEDPRYATNQERVSRREELRTLLVERMKSKPVDHWIGALKEAGIPWGGPGPPPGVHGSTDPRTGHGRGARASDCRRHPGPGRPDEARGHPGLRSHAPSDPRSALTRNLGAGPRPRRDAVDRLSTDGVI